MSGAADDGCAEMGGDPGALGGAPHDVHFFHGDGRRGEDGLAAMEAEDALVRGGGEVLGVGVGIGGEEREADHGVRFFQVSGGMEIPPGKSPGLRAINAGRIARRMRTGGRARRRAGR